MDSALNDCERPTHSVADFAVIPERAGYRSELAEGRLVREPAPAPLHGRVAGRIYQCLLAAAEKSGRGMVFFDTGFVLARLPDTVRVPDVAFVARDRIPEGGAGDRFWELAPDLTVEVASPSDRPSALREKALEYLAAGGTIVWIVDPATRTVTEHRSAAETRVREVAEVLTAPGVLPGLDVVVEELFNDMSLKSNMDDISS